MQRLEVSCAVRPIYGSLGAKGLKYMQGKLLLVYLPPPPLHSQMEFHPKDVAHTGYILRLNHYVFAVSADVGKAL
jgi:hypothetical protein